MVLELKGYTSNINSPPLVESTKDLHRLLEILQIKNAERYFH